jgi:Tol biopolymer transport system component
MTRLFRNILAIIIIAGGPVAVSAQQDYFGQNKVQYRDFRWQIMTTPHFEIYYYEGEEETARDSARMAERSYDRLSRILRHRFSDPIPLILYASHTDFQQTNVLQSFLSEGTGGVTEFMKNRVILPFTGSYAELEHVLTHELVHAFQGDILFGNGPSASMLNPMAFAPPLWFMEGMAEYLSLGRIDEHTDMWLRDAALQGYLPPIMFMDFSFGLYRFGQGLFSYIGERYGDEKIGEILRKSGRLRSMDDSFKSSIGKDMEELSEDWTEHVRRTYLPQIKDFEKPESFSRQLTDIQNDRASFHLAASISPRGDKMVYISNQSLYNDIYLASAIDGRIISKLLEGERTGEFESLRFFTTAISWSPNEQFIAFPAKTGAKDAIYVLDVRKKKVVRKIKVDLDGVQSPSWSPDGREIVFVGLKGGQSDIYTVDVTGKNLKALTQDRYTDRDPVWSPDGTQIAISTDRSPITDFESLTFAHQQLGLYDLASGEIEMLPAQYGKSISPQWSGDGKKLAFISDRTGISNIFITDLEDRQTYQITNILTGVTNITASGPAISWAQKGNRLVFNAFAMGGWEIFSISDPTRLMETPYEHLGNSDDGPIGPPEQLAPSLRTARSNLSSVESDSTFDSTIALGDIDSTGIGQSETTVVEIEANDDTPMLSGVETSTDIADSTALSSDEIPGLSQVDLPPTSQAIVQDLPGQTSELPDTSVWTDGTFKTKPYSPRFTLDFIGGSAGYASSVGFVGQSLLSFSDVLGNHNMVFGASVFGSITEADALFQYTNLSRRTNYGFALFQYRFDQLYTFQSPILAQTQTQINRGLQLFISRPFSKFNRFELALQGVSRSRKLVEITTNQFFGLRRETVGDLGSVNFFSPIAAVVTDNVLYGVTGPIAGERGRLEVTPTVGGLQFTRFLADYRKYYNVMQRYSFAFRGYGMVSHGRDQELVPFGGPYDFRGLGFWSAWGSKLALFNAEFRFPLIDVLAMGWPLPIVFQQVRGSLFLDFGGVWDQSTSTLQAGSYSGYPNAGSLVGSQLVRPNGLVGPSTIEEVAGGPVAMAYGFGIRSRLGFLVLKFDIANQIDLGTRPSWYNNENIVGIPTGIESEFPGTRSYRLREALDETRFFFTIGADF